jgi:integral membrane protein
LDRSAPAHDGLGAWFLPGGKGASETPLDFFWKIQTDDSRGWFDPAFDRNRYPVAGSRLRPRPLEVANMKRIELRYFRLLGMLEGTSLLTLLFIAMPAKRLFGEPALVKHVGLAHGILFLMYMYTLLTVALDLKWSIRRCALAFIVASIPFGTFWFDRKYLSHDAENF